MARTGSPRYLKSNTLAISVDGGLKSGVLMGRYGPLTPAGGFGEFAQPDNRAAAIKRNVRDLIIFK